MLVGTTSIENSEIIDGLLTKADLPHQVLNAKQHAREAEIVAQAGRPKMITIATNMAGRGTDIVLGGNVEKAIEAVEADEALDRCGQGGRDRAPAQRVGQGPRGREVAGGLRIIGTERHESRRIDNQLRGRSGRQGDPGSSRFYLCLDDPLMRIFAGDRVKAIMDRLKMPEGEAIEAGIVTRCIESAQRKVEARNFDIRKQLLEYDDVANDQRKVIYQQRNDILDAGDLSAQIAALREGCFTDLVRQYVPAESVEEQWDLAGLEKVAGRRVGHRAAAAEGRARQPTASPTKTSSRRWSTAANEAFEAKVALIGAGELHPVRAHRDAAEHRHPLARAPGGARPPAPGHPPARLCAEEAQAGIQARGLRAVRPAARLGQERSHQELMTVQVQSGEQLEAGCRGDGKPWPSRSANVTYTAPTETGEVEIRVDEESQRRRAASGLSAGAAAFARVGRNDPCPCGSGKKYKHCHGKLN